jgi:xylan 1,4-beta-xylosidase
MAFMLVRHTSLVCVLFLAVCRSYLFADDRTVVIDVNAPSHAFPHFWEQTFGSGRAILTLRESYRSDLREVKRVSEFRYVRFHAILHDEVGVYNEDQHGNAVHNFSYADQIYDGLLKNGVKPFLEISFMPNKLAAFQAIHPFWYKQNVAPPKSYARWDELIRDFGRHLVDRYGIDEVATWYFEVWNEPNIDFWEGQPKQSTYFELYDHTARALKAVSPRLRVGGPATAAADWVPEFIAHCHASGIPLDFISTHGYADDTVENLFHTHENIPMDKRVCRAIDKVHGQIGASAQPRLPLMWTEWNVPSFGPLNARDTIYVGPALASDILQCDGLVDMMSFWTFNDVFEETGVVETPFHGGFGLIAASGIKKPSFNAFALLHKLGHQRIKTDSDNVLATREGNSLILATWNLVDPGQQGTPMERRLHFKGVKADASVQLSRLDNQHGNTLAAYKAMGSPRYPTQAQMDQLNQAAELPAPERRALKAGELDLVLSPNELIIIELPIQ